jgi:hypothetical protein
MESQVSKARPGPPTTHSFALADVMVLGEKVQAGFNIDQGSL